MTVQKETKLHFDETAYGEEMQPPPVKLVVDPTWSTEGLAAFTAAGQHAIEPVAKQMGIVHGHDHTHGGVNT